MKVELLVSLCTPYGPLSKGQQIHCSVIPIDTLREWASLGYVKVIEEEAEQNNALRTPKRQTRKRSDKHLPGEVSSGSS